MSNIIVTQAHQKTPAMNEIKNTLTKDDSVAEGRIWKWLDEVVIGQNFCPFAKVPRSKKQVKLLVVQETANQQVLAILANECAFLVKNPNIETSLIALTHCLGDFYDYLDVLDMAQQMLADLEYEGVFQLASFHPQYLFQGEPNDAVSHYTNRAPYPIFHLIREQSISKALAFFDKPESIVTRNIDHAHSLGAAFFKAYL